ncbi:hypothetical protein PIB30_056094 [Stylosanthes scabra]|uniref:Uncharacterized protein n=1 Tax=Stylosanthes scabra TaxID=79078 RepID=A0ABU6VIV2_9FABA|nr:hypothetical protein [Stylosanthes scabra]
MIAEEKVRERTANRGDGDGEPRSSGRDSLRPWLRFASVTEREKRPMTHDCERVREHAGGKKAKGRVQRRALP